MKGLLLVELRDLGADTPSAAQEGCGASGVSASPAVVAEHQGPAEYNVILSRAGASHETHVQHIGVVVGQPLSFLALAPVASALSAPHDAARRPHPPQCSGTSAQRSFWLREEWAQCQMEMAVGSQ